MEKCLHRMHFYRLMLRRSLTASKHRTLANDAARSRETEKNNAVYRRKLCNFKLILFANMPWHLQRINEQSQKLQRLNVGKILKTTRMKWHRADTPHKHTHARAHTGIYDDVIICNYTRTLTYSIHWSHCSHCTRSPTKTMDGMGAARSLAFDKFRNGFPQNVSKFKAFVCGPS